MSKATVAFTKDTAMATGVITGPIARPDAHLVDQRWIEARFDQAPVSGQVPPNQVAQGRQQPEDGTVEAEGDGVSGISAQEGRCERDQGDAHEGRECSATRACGSRARRNGIPGGGRTSKLPGR